MSEWRARVAFGAGTAATIALFAAAGYGLGAGVAPAVPSRMFPWILGRATGIGAYVALTGMVLTGLLFRQPVRVTAAVQRETFLRFHLYLGPALGGLIAVHIGSLLADRYAGVGWAALAVPGGATYRPNAVTFGMIGMYLIGVVLVSAALAGRRLIRGRWAGLHKLAYPAFATAWVHGVFAGSDTTTLRWMYALSGVAVVAAGARSFFRRPLGARAGVPG